MELVKYLERVVDVCSRVIRFGAGMQAQVRDELKNDLQAICTKVDEAHKQTLKMLRPIKDNLNDRDELASALRDFATDPATRDAFKPEHLCGEVDALLQKLESNLDPLKYAVDVRKLRSLRDEFGRIGNVDAAIYHEYDAFTRDLDDLATELQAGTDSLTDERKDYAKHIIRDFEDDISQAAKSMREAKDRILR